jgi:hypothetical protein
MVDNESTENIVSWWTIEKGSSHLSLILDSGLKDCKKIACDIF